jgi:hypothetical protein
MLGVSPVGVALKGTVTGVIFLRFLGLFISHPLTCPPCLHRFMLPGFVATMRALTSANGRLLSACTGRFAPRVTGAQLAAWFLIIQNSITGMLPGTYVLAISSSPCFSRLNF